MVYRVGKIKFTALSDDTFKLLTQVRFLFLQIDMENDDE